MFLSPFTTEVTYCFVAPGMEQHYAQQGYGLSKEEIALTVNFSPQRKEEFWRGRFAAHIALHGLEISEPFSVLRGENGEPEWPEGIVGSLSHAEEYAVAAVALKQKINLLGIDLQKLSVTLQHDISKRICRAEELKMLASYDQQSQRRKMTLLLFSAKECIYKAFSAYFQPTLGFQDVLLQWQEKKHSFLATFTRDFSTITTTVPATGRNSFEIGASINGDWAMTYLAYNVNGEKAF